MKVIIITLALLLATWTQAHAAFPPEVINAAVKEHCEGNVTALLKEEVDGKAIYEIVCSDGEDEYLYFFSDSGRLIHAVLNDDADDFDDEDDFEDEEKSETFE